MRSCTDCNINLESWEVACRQCGKVLSPGSMPTVEQALVSDAGLEESFRQWFERGKSELAALRYEEAVACFQEALRRLRGLEKGREREVKLRSLLAQALENSMKLAEAAQQLDAVAELSESEKERADLSARAAEMREKAVDLSLTTTGEDVYRPLEPGEAKVVPLYCAQCRRLLSEAEGFGFRRAVEEDIRCLCGFQGKPMAKLDAKHQRSLREAKVMLGRKAQLVEAASRDFPKGKNKYVAAALAIVFGDLGVHKFYLGERGAGFVYALFCWTFVPWIFALFEAIEYFSMSKVTFNLSYNIDRVLEAIPAETSIGEDHSELFSMEVTEDPEDFVDEFTAGGGALSGKPE